jgi:transposase
LDTHPTFGVFFMTKYDESFKRSVVQEYLSGVVGYNKVGIKHGVNNATVRQWVESYLQHGEAGLRKQFSHYSAEFKRSVLGHMEREQLSYRQVAVLFDLRGGVGVVSAWERQYHEGGLDALKPKPRGRAKKMTSPESPKPVPTQPTDTRTLEDLRKENEYLRAEVAYLKKLDALVRAKQQAAQKKHKP